MIDDNATSQEDSPLVQCGIFDWIDRNQLSLPDLYEQRFQCLEYADAAGFYCYHLAEHQATPLAMAPSPSVFLAAPIQRTHHIRLGPLVYLLPLYNPLRLGQEICMLDNLSRGRLEVGIGRGVSPYELTFYNVTPQESRAMFREALDILMAGLTTGEVSYAGEYFSFKNVRLHIAPCQRPYHPPLWYPTDNANSITWLAQEGLNTITHYPPMTTIRELFDLYKRVWQEHKTNPERLNAHVPEPKYGIKPGLPLPTSSPTSITCAWCRVTLVAGQRTWPILTLAGRRDCTSWGRRTLSSSRCRSTYRSPARTILSAPFASARLLARKYCTPCDCVGSFEPPFPCRLDTAQFNGPLPCVCSRRRSCRPAVCRCVGRPERLSRAEDGTSRSDGLRSKPLFSSAQYAMIARTDGKDSTSRKDNSQWYLGGEAEEAQVEETRGPQQRRASWRLRKSIT